VLDESTHYTSLRREVIRFCATLYYTQATGDRMKIRIGALEIVDPTPEELDMLIAKYAGAIQHGSETPGNGGEHQGSQKLNASAKDRVVLNRLVSAGSEGVATQELGETLGRLGKSIRPGLIEWAQRIGLTHDAEFDPFEECRVGTRRGIRLKSSLLSVAKQIQQGG
jgi:hypothetical protein